MIRLTILLPILVLLPFAQAEPPPTGQLYKWEDEQGRVHYSDRVPVEPGSPVEVQPLPRQPPTGSTADDDYYSIENQAKRLEDERKNREEARSEAEQKRLEEKERIAELEEARARAKRLEQENQRESYPQYVFPVLPIDSPARPILPRAGPIPVPLPSGGVSGVRP